MSPRQPPKPPTSDVKRVGVWVRVSTEDQVKGESPEHHEKRARFYAESKGWKVATVFRLDGLSGKSVMGYPETQRMLEEVRSGRISGLIFSKLARLARNTKELLEFSEIFREHGADLISLQESIDTSSPAGRLFYTMIAAMAEWERAEIAERVAASVPIRAMLGKPISGAPPFGYCWEGKKLVPDPKYAPMRRRVYELFLQHRRKKTVARLMNEEGLRTRNGSKFSDTTIDRLIRDPTAKGVRRANYTKSTGDGKHWVLKPESEWVHTSVEAIVSEDLWNQCNAILNERRESGKRPARRTVHLFAGLAFCECGGKMYVYSGYPKYVCAKCRNKIGTTDLEEIFREQLKEFSFSPDELAAHLDQADEHIAEKRKLLETVEVERDSVKAEMDKVYRLYVGDKITEDGFGRAYKPLEERLHGLEDQLPRLQAEMDFLRIQNLSRDEIIAEAQNLYSRWADLLPTEKRQIVEDVVERITVGKTDVNIDLAYSPSPRATAASRTTSDKKATQECECGYLGDEKRECRCSASSVDRYRRRLSGPLRDRFDLSVEVQAVPWNDLRGTEPAESTAAVRARVIDARTRQVERQRVLNAQLDGPVLRRHCRVNADADRLLGQAVERLGLSARGVARVLRVARTIADLAGADDIAGTHVAEALQFRLPS